MLTRTLEDVFPTWPFALVLWAVMGLIPPLAVFYMKREWRVPWWHWPIAATAMGLAMLFLFLHAWERHLVWNPYTLRNGNFSHGVFFDGVAESIQDSGPMGVLILLVSGLIVWRGHHRDSQQPT